MEVPSILFKFSRTKVKWSVMVLDSRHQKLWERPRQQPLNCSNFPEPKQNKQLWFLIPDTQNSGRSPRNTLYTVQIFQNQSKVISYGPWSFQTPKALGETQATPSVLFKIYRTKTKWSVMVLDSRHLKLGERPRQCTLPRSNFPEPKHSKQLWFLIPDTKSSGRGQGCALYTIQIFQNQSKVISYGPWFQTPKALGEALETPFILFKFPEPM